MNEQQMRQLDREKALLRYMTALEKGDFETIAAILLMAEQDGELEQIILEINDLQAAEIEQAAHAENAATVRELIHTHIISALPESAPEPPPLTVGHVIARIHADAALRGRVEREALAATRPHQGVETPLPTDLSLRGVSRLLEQIGVKVSRRFQDLFRDTALFMRMGRNQNMARMAATRQQQARNKPYAHFNPQQESLLQESKPAEYTPTEEQPEQDKPSSEESR